MTEPLYDLIMWRRDEYDDDARYGESYIAEHGFQCGLTIEEVEADIRLRQQHQSSDKEKQWQFKLCPASNLAESVLLPLLTRLDAERKAEEERRRVEAEKLAEEQRKKNEARNAVAEAKRRRTLYETLKKEFEP